MVPADSRRIPRAPRYSGYRYASCRFVYASFTLCGGTFQNLPLTTLLATSRSYYPDRAGTLSVWALPRSLATTWGITDLFSFPPGTKMFQFPGLAPHCGGWSSTSRVVPFGDPRVKGHLHLTAAFRSLSRPSSPVRAKASAIRPFLLSFARHLPDPAASLQQCCSIADAGRRLVYFRLSL